MYTANQSQPRVVVRGLLDIPANSVNQRTNIGAQGNRMPIQRKPRTDYPNQGKRGQRNHPRQNRHHNQTNCRDEFAPILVRSKKKLHVQHHKQYGHVKADKNKGHRSVNSMNCEIASSFSVKLKRVTTKSFSVILSSSARTGLGHQRPAWVGGRCANIAGEG